MTVLDEFAKIAAALYDDGLIDEMPAESRGKFGSNGLKVNGKPFALDVSGDLVLKLPKARVDELVANGAGKQFDPDRGRNEKARRVAGFSV